MEELLNKLIEKGWNPFGVEAKKIYIDKNEITIERLNGFRVVYTTRQISSIDSGLWQFVCENKMVDREHKRPAYRIIESALKDENELEDFLLSNIKVDG